MKIRGIDLLGTWLPHEVLEARRVLEPLPGHLLEENPHFNRLVRRPVLTDAPPEAPGHSKYEPDTATIVVYDKGVYHGGKIDPEQFRRSIYHELAHSLIRGTPTLLERWSSETNGDGFVDDYARTNAEEDFADTLSEYLLDPSRTSNAVPKKAAFIRMQIVPPQEKVAMPFKSQAQQRAAFASAKSPAEKAKVKEWADKTKNIASLPKKLHPKVNPKKKPVHMKLASPFSFGFAEELVKMARPGMGRLARMFGRKGGRKAIEAAGHVPGKMGIGKSLALAGGLGGAGLTAGVLEGKKKGFEEGTEDLMDVAQRARMIGRREGVLAYHQALMEQRKKMGG